jgi:hypothetical protein
MALGHAGRGSTGPRWPGRSFCASHAERPGKAVTNQVTTAPGIASRSTTCHDSTPPSSCGNAMLAAVSDGIAMPDTEEVTGSNPVRPTRHFLFLALPGTLRGPTTGPTARATDMPRSQAHGHRRGRAQAPSLRRRHARERFREEEAFSGSGPPTCAQIAGRRAFSPNPSMTERCFIRRRDLWSAGTIRWLPSSGDLIQARARSSHPAGWPGTQAPARRAAAACQRGKGTASLLSVHKHVDHLCATAPSLCICSGNAGDSAACAAT